MNYPQNLKQVFAPLGARLYLFESKMYLTNFAEDDLTEIWEDRMETTYDHDLMYKIGKLVNAFDSRDVILEAFHYDNRIVKVLAELQPREWDYEMKTGPLVKIDIEESKKTEQKELWEGELRVYRYYLQQIVNARSEFLNDEEKGKLEETHIPYPTAQFEISKLNEISTRSTVSEFINFKQKLSPEQIALFMHYLVHLGIMPPYNPAGVGKLTKYFFARSDRTRSLYKPWLLEDLKKDPENLDSIHRIFSSLLKLVDIDISDQGLKAE